VSDIFISYAAEDRELARSLAGALSAQGWQVWWDREIPFGRSFDEVIETAVAGARSMIVLWSRHSVESDWVKSEAREGRARRILIPVLIEPVRIPLEFRHLQTADLTNWVVDVRHPQFDQLVVQLGALLGSARPRTVDSRAHRRDVPLNIDIPLGHDARTRPVTPTAPPIGRRVAIAALAAMIVGIAGLGLYRMSMRAGPPTPTAVGTLGSEAPPPAVGSTISIAPPPPPPPPPPHQLQRTRWPNQRNQRPRPPVKRRRPPAKRGANRARGAIGALEDRRNRCVCDFPVSRVNQSRMFAPH